MNLPEKFILNLIKENNNFPIFLLKNDLLNNENLKILFETEDLSVILIILKYKLILTHKNNAVQQAFDIDKLFERISDGNINLLHDITFYSLLNQPSLNYAREICVKSCLALNCVKDKNIILYNLEIIDVILQICLLLKNNVLNDDMQDNLHKIIVNLICNDENDVWKKICLDIIPKYIQCIQNHDLLICLWRKLNCFTEDKTLIALEQYFFPQIYNKHHFNILNEETFWLKLQNNICSSNSGLKKQSLYLLKKAVYTLLSNESYIKNFQTKFDIIIWNTNKLEDYKISWKNLFILCEVSNEKQIHLIEPTFKLYNSLKILHFSWRNIVTTQFIFHPHSAVVRQSVINILKGDWYCDIDTLLQGLNNNFLYENSFILLDYLNLYISKIAQCELPILIDKICWMHLSPIPLYYMCKCISSTDLKDVNLKYIIDLIVLNEKVPHLYIRKGILHFIFICFSKIYINIDKFDTNFMEILIKIVHLFYRNKYLQRDNVAWKQVIQLLIKKRCLYKDTEEINWIKNFYMLTKEHSVITVLLLDAKIVDLNWIQNYLQHILKSESKNKLHDFECLFNTVKVTLRYDEIFEDTIFHEEDFKNIFNKLFNICSELEISMYTTNFFESIEFILDVILQKIVLNKNFYDLFTLFLDKFENRNICYMILSKKVVYAYELNLNTRTISCKDELHTLLIKLKNSKKNYKNELNEVLNENSIKQKILSNYYYTKLSVRKILFKISKGIDANDNILEKVNKYYDKGGLDIIISIIDTLGIIVKNCSLQTRHSSFVLEFLNLLIRCQKDIFNFRTNKLFRPAITKFIAVILHPQLFQIDILKEYIDNFCLNMFDSSQIITGIRNEILNRMILHFLSPNLLVEALLFGQILRKDQRIEFETCNLILQDIKHLNLDVTNSCQLDAKVRSKAVGILLIIINNVHLYNRNVQEFCDSILQLLMKKYNETTGKRYFGDSQIHLTKLRVLQCLHLLIPKLNNLLAIGIEKWLFDCLTNESHQPSVRILIQWLLVRIYEKLNDKENTINKLILLLQNLKGTSCTLIFPIFYHLVKYKSIEMNIVYKCMEILLPYTMGQQFNIRFSAQVAVYNIYQIYSSEPEFIKKYELLYKTIIEVINKTSKDKLNDSILTYCNMTSSIKTIFYDIPRLTNVTRTEWLPVNYFNGIINMKLLSNDEVSILENVTKKTQIPVSESNNDNVNVQKKIEPFTTSTIDENYITNCVGNLIIVACLIDKIPNLGGLSRTCEVFGVKQYVINNIQFVKNKEYQSLSMSSEKWIDTIEIKTENLPQFLLHMKKKNYRIVGAEQTSEGKRLDNIKFNANTVLLLGNEKEGIPPNLLYLLDECIEIPQFGHIRSLNVHVAGALFIWEYVKQHCNTT